MTKSLVTLVGNKHRGRAAMDLLASLPNGEALTLIREPDNKYDCNCIQVWTHGLHIGFVKKEQAVELAARIDATAKTAGVAVTSLMTPAKLAIDGSQWPMIEVDE